MPKLVCVFLGFSVCVVDAVQMRLCVPYLAGVNRGDRLVEKV